MIVKCIRFTDKPEELGFEVDSDAYMKMAFSSGPINHLFHDKDITEWELSHMLLRDYKTLLDAVSEQEKTIERLLDNNDN